MARARCDDEPRPWDRKRATVSQQREDHRRRLEDDSTSTSRPPHDVPRESASAAASDAGVRSFTREQVLEWRSYWSDDDRAYIGAQIDRFQLVSFTAPKVAQYVWCFNAAGERVMKILPGRVEMHVAGEEWHQLSKRDDSTPITREQALRWYKFWSADDRGRIESEIDRLQVVGFSVPRSEGYVKGENKDGRLVLVLHPGFIEGYAGFDATHVNRTKGAVVFRGMALFGGAAWRQKLSISGYRAPAVRGAAAVADAPSSAPAEVVWVTVYYDGDEDEMDTFLLGPRHLADSDSVDAEVVSPQSPLGVAVTGVAAGETATYTVPKTGRTVEVTVVSVEPYGVTAGE